MINNEEKYQNLLEQIHELNRQNFLNDNDKLEELSKKLTNIEDKLSLKEHRIFDRNIFILIGLFSLNLILSLYIVFNINEIKSSDKSVATKTENVKIEKKQDIDKNSAVEFNKTNVETSINDEFEEIKPIIRKGTPYSCIGENVAYKTPYTVEIKGKLYADKFTFILHENNTSKECFIKKENI